MKTLTFYIVKTQPRLYSLPAGYCITRVSANTNAVKNVIRALVVDLEIVDFCEIPVRFTRTLVFLEAGEKPDSSGNEKPTYSVDRVILCVQINVLLYSTSFWIQQSSFPVRRPYEPVPHALHRHPVLVIKSLCALCLYLTLATVE